MPLTGDPSKDIPELIHHGTRKRSRKQIIAIALAEQRRRGGKKRRKKKSAEDAPIVAKPARHSWLKRRRKRRIARRQNYQYNQQVKGLHPWLTKGPQWDENKHRREHGKFSSTGGSSVDRHNPALDAAMNEQTQQRKPQAGEIRENRELDRFMQEGNEPAKRTPEQHAQQVAQQIGRVFQIGKKYKVREFIDELRNVISRIPPESANAFAQHLGLTPTDTPKQVVEKFYAKFGGGKIRVNWHGSNAAQPGKQHPPPLPNPSGYPRYDVSHLEAGRIRDTKKRQPPPLPSERQAQARQQRAGTHHRGGIVVSRKRRPPPLPAGRKYFHQWLTT